RVVGVVGGRRVRDGRIVVLTDQGVGVVAGELGVVPHLVAGRHGDGTRRQIEYLTSDGHLEDLEFVLALADVVRIHVNPVDYLLGVVGDTGDVIGRAGIGRAEGVPPKIAVGATHAVKCQLHTREAQQFLVLVTSRGLSGVVGVTGPGVAHVEAGADLPAIGVIGHCLQTGASGLFNV